jgi:hypothetical protein
MTKTERRNGIGIKQIRISKQSMEERGKDGMLGK